jgi:hypothetical protein
VPFPATMLFRIETLSVGAPTYPVVALRMLRP